jgi:hypothetical protein
MSETRERLIALTKQLSDEGRLIEAGWVGLRAAAVPPSAPPVQIREMRLAFMAGAQHLFASLNAIIDEGREPTDDDLRRFNLIADELNAFTEEMKRDARFADEP